MATKSLDVLAMRAEAIEAGNLLRSTVAALNEGEETTDFTVVLKALEMDATCQRKLILGLVQLLIDGDVHSRSLTNG